MEKAISDMITALQLFWTESWFMTFVKFLALVYILVVIVDIVLIVLLTDVKASMRENKTGAHRPAGSKKKYRKRWAAIEERADTGLVPQYKVAILEADAFVLEVLDALGFHGKNMAESLAGASGYSLETRDRLLEAHEVRNRIVQDPGFTLTPEEAAVTLGHFREFLDEVDLI